MMTHRHNDVDCYGSYEVEAPSNSNPDEWISFIFEIGFSCQDMGHSGYFDPISGVGEGPYGPVLEEIEWTIYWEDGSRTSPSWEELADIIPNFDEVVESCYESACEELRERDY